MAMVALRSPMPVIPGVSRARAIVRIWLGIRVVRPLVVPVWIIIVARRIGITVPRKSKAESPNPWKSRGDLSVSTLPGNEGQPAYRQSNQEKLLHRFSSSICFGFCLLFCAGRLRVFLYRGIRMRSAPRLPRRIKWGWPFDATRSERVNNCVRCSHGPVGRLPCVRAAAKWDRPQAGGYTIYEPALAVENSIRTEGLEFYRERRLIAVEALRTPTSNPQPNPVDAPFFGDDNARPC
jgi:hypothetical protein